MINLFLEQLDPLCKRGKQFHYRVTLDGNMSGEGSLVVKTV